MKRLLTLIILVILCCLGCQKSQDVTAVDNEKDIQAIKDVVAEWNATLNAADIDGIMSFYSDDAVRIAPNELASIGKEAIRSRVQEMLDNLILQEQWTVENVQFSGSSTIVLLSWSAEGKPKAGGEPFKANGSWIQIFENKDSDVWKCTYSIWSDVSLIHTDQAE